MLGKQLGPRCGADRADVRQVVGTLEALYRTLCLVPVDAGHGNREAGAIEVLLRPDDQIAPAPLRELRVETVGAVHTRDALGYRVLERLPLAAVRLLPVPPAHAVEVV